jgi:murein DD-endopeptidase MepM/ murein hydrolase activator NlpD
VGRRGIQIAAATAAALSLAAPAAASQRRHEDTRRVQQSLARTFEWPAAGMTTTPFTRLHHGLDIGVLRSLTVRAAVGGRVVAVGYATGYEGYGNIVVVEVTPHVETIYAHLSSFRVHPGEHVRMGEELGIAGCTGICTGTHLHFEVREDGVAVDPRYFLR